MRLEHREIDPFGERSILAAARRDKCARQRMRSKPASQCFTVEAVGYVIHDPKAGLTFAADFASESPLDLFLRPPIGVDAQPLGHLTHLGRAQHFSLLWSQRTLGVIVAVGTQPKHPTRISGSEMQS